MRRILVTAVGGDIGNGILKILRETDAEVYGCDMAQYAAGMDKVKRFFVVPPATRDNYVETLIELCRENRISYLIPVSEIEIEVLSEKRELFENKGIRLLIQDDELLNICLDKYNCMSFLKKHQICVPDTWLATEEIERTGQRIIKPRKSCGSRDIRIIEDNEKLKTEEKTEENIVQAYIPGEKEYTVGVFSDGTNTNIIAFLRKLKNGTTDYVELVAIPEIESIAGRISEIFNLRGFINVQLREWNGSYYIFEINPRISGTLNFRHMLGYCDVLWWLDILDGKLVEPYLCPYECAIGLRELSEKFIKIKKKLP